MSRRLWTPDRIILQQSERMLVQSPKRDCDQCRTRLGDLTDNELAVAMLPGRRLPPSRGECPLCLGFHAVLVEPAAPVEPGDVVRLQPARLMCPGTPAGKLHRDTLAVASCATWERCGCEYGKDIEYPSSEWVEFLDMHCPTSPTGEHRHLIERDQDGTPYVGAPQTGTCRYATAVDRLADEDMTYLDRMIADFATEPGLYPVEIEEFDADTLVFELLDITPHLPAEVLPL